MYEFLMSQTPGPFIFRRIAVDAIQFTQKDPENFKLNTGLMNFNGNLKKGIIFQGYRFHDDRVINSLLYSGSMIRLQYGEKTHVIDFEDNIVRAGIIHHKDALRLRQIAELYIDGRFVGNATIDLVVLHGKNYTRREATIKAAPGLELKNVQVALGYDNLSSNGKDLTYHRGFLWRRPGIFNSFECLGTPLQAISNGPIDWYALYQDENLGFSHAIITIPEKRDRVEAIVSEGVRAGRFHYVYTWYNLNDISDSASAGIAEKTILLAGGLYHSFPSYAPIFENLEHYSRKDMSISYDFGAELNAVAALAFREASDGIDYNTGKFFNEKTMVWFDEKFNAFRDNLLKTKLFKRPYLFSRGLAFAAIACDALYRATGNPKYLKWQFDCC
ncbi:MAG: hypothetical protein KKH68_13600, partial [Proteobacteria bacterium]|nr:hypothetical protein [Pseudomonadota bacterium]